MRQLSTTTILLACCAGFVVLFLIGCQRQIPHLQDLDFMYNQIKQNHPGMYNAQDPTFKSTLERAYQQAREAITQTTDTAVHRQAMEAFTNNFNDAHLRILWNQDTDEQDQPAIDNPTALFTVRNLGNKASWITVPTFFNLTSKQQQSLDQLIQAMPTLKHQSALIFDLRGNPGGNSRYAQQILEALFGQDYVQQQLNIADQNTFIDWRASRDNLAHVQSLYDRFGYSCFKQAAEGISHSIARDEPYYRQISTCPQTASEPKTNHSHDVSARIFVIIDQANVSSALRFIDYLKLIRYPVTLVGKTTKADRLYTEVRTVPLPSNSGLLIFPIKIIRNRIRGDNEPYVPDYEHNATDTAQLETFIMQKIAEQQRT